MLDSCDVCQSKRIQTASTWIVRTNVGIVFSYKSLCQKSHDHCYENNGEIQCCKQLSLEYKLCLEEHTQNQDSAKDKDNHN